MPHHPLLDVPELTNLDAGRGLVRIPVEQDVPFTPRVRALVDTPEFQRLARITQLGLGSRVYPGATHTRFEHALGVYHNALRYLWQLGKDARFAAIIEPHHAEVLLASALLHDLGHWPFCHPIEDMELEGLPPHEQFAAEFLAPDRKLADVLRESWRIEPDEVLDVLVPRTNSPALRLMRSILSGPIDIDKMDYLERDSLHAGVPYGRNFDKNRLIESLLVNSAGDGLAISAKGRTAAELMVFARYVMFSEVYWHHAVRSATSMFARAFYELYRQMDLRSLFSRSEADFVDELRRRARGTSVEPLAEGIFGATRSLYKRAAEYSVYQSPEIYHRLSGQPYEVLVRCADRLAKHLSAALNDTIPPASILIDAQPQRKETQLRIDIFYPKEGIYRSLEEISPVAAALGRAQFDDCVKRVRVFADPGAARRIAALPDFAAHLCAAIEETAAGAA